MNEVGAHYGGRGNGWAATWKDDPERPAAEAKRWRTIAGSYSNIADPCWDEITLTDTVVNSSVRFGYGRLGIP